MDQSETKEILQAVRQSLDRLLLRDRAHLNALMRRVRQCIHDEKPVDKLVGKLQDVHFKSLERAQKRAAVKLKIDYPEILPISGKRADIQKLVAANQVVIVCGTTGSGKTTQLPKIVLEAGSGKTGRIGVTQPRRLAATGMARRVARNHHQVHDRRHPAGGNPARPPSAAIRLPDHRRSPRAQPEY